MIPKKEILARSLQWNIPHMTVDKDYALSWILAGIAHHPDLADQWIFKGGTCLKKCYFADYRFSEDLDFTVINTEHLNPDWLLARFTEIADWIYSHSELRIVRKSMNFRVRQQGSIEGRLYYRGPMQPRTNFPRIKIDLTCNELRALPADKRPLLHSYSDDLPQQQVNCYSIEELFAEKLRALFQRIRPRDLYDVIHLDEQKQYFIDREKLADAIKRKFIFKDLPLPTLETLESHPHRNDIPTQWEHMLGHQVARLGPVENYWDRLPGILDKIAVVFGGVEMYTGDGN